jgi:hypothetical protein
MKGNALGRTLPARAGTPPLAGFRGRLTVALPRFAAGRREDRSFILGPLGAWPPFFLSAPPRDRWPILRNPNGVGAVNAASFDRRRYCDCSASRRLNIKTS